jgi:hypothetical protein
MRPSNSRATIELGDRENAKSRLGDFGKFVGERTGQNRRTQDQIDDFCVRHMVLGLLSSDRLPIPRFISMLHPDPEGHWPDALLTWADGEITGLEVTTATSEAYQRQLTKEERIANALPEDEFVAFDCEIDGYAGAAERAVAKDVVAAIQKKTDALNSGKYSAVNVCDLLIYENSDGGLLSNSPESIGKIASVILFGEHRLVLEQRRQFRHTHLLTSSFFVHSLLTNPRLFNPRRAVASAEVNS